MEVHAKLRYFRQSPKKVRLVADSIRGLAVLRARTNLQFAPNFAATPLLKLLNSAIANGEHNFQLKKENLFIKEIRVDQGPALKRWRPRAFGRASGIRKETSHVLIVLGEIKPTTDHKITAEKKDEKLATAKVVNSLDEIKESVLDEDKDSGARKSSGIKTKTAWHKDGQKGKKRFFSRKSG
ncbi:50S ribosomal protein L22 [Candidatus Kuenenbacteria bacterium RIFCSPLOWO2_12_FULL_42_13]|uniref:Large ribosomal subunit protein uL22 n=5 Tax=Candidatus Kueneniibacteriota TaxID=1752740 RepID=A0A0G0YWQ3_9BACT|nr:MAG: 50S ribosomal protein L22 [Candidatus Kuenenbacteria bacterium GW2011_GWA2_42_15]OGG89418.1 MAG: 50S ribosomal protein L22 [Candidatus Kuenenbacteria bacterium RIFCSPHIGHO2_02_FULL_42_29]OGG89775.1 MAG: 50S ribosomal protein L22 [Candidatus Kuenenbacteria bacterium RIFCSPLOWO2_02_FULL_42_16]OGG91712.1 MAG: 50S ribosomal protein L22 [Candidatus Kuenenbacteria bacterium RIFCSPLOWO2_12_FULL_42_13]OGG95797.1 MAG: 50S ribosomal protein L22 [Candidatus Kuenenbacteria bacterium RBG_16_41_7]OG